MVATDPKWTIIACERYSQLSPEYLMMTTEYRSSTAVLLLVICGCATADCSNIEGLDTELSTFSDFQISQTRICPEEPVVVFAKMTNALDEPIELRLAPGSIGRALLQIRNSMNELVWDTDEWDRLEEKRHAEEHGIGRIFVGPTIQHATLDPGASAYWIARWE